MKDKKYALDSSLNNRECINESNICGCYCCTNTFKPEQIRVWIDDGQTAVCPYCGIDTVLSEKSGYLIKEEELREIQSYWF